ncbi:MAG: succinylglutamate desuccinylase/aspartoacylase family protein [Clostridia bacterium]|nr:succinylglutamate desuccinylase/aspartoacylase family protein [Clostridia bacterium]
MKKKGILSTCIILAIAIVCAAIAGNSFYQKRHFQEDIVTEGSGVTRTYKLSTYNKNLKGTIANVDIYVLEGKEPGGSILILGGTHANEPAGHMAAVVMLEQLTVEKGTVYVIPQINMSGLSHNDPLEGQPQYIHFTTSDGDVRTFHFGSRAANPIDQWPDPDIYTHKPSGQGLSGSETRNLNRCYPGVKYGTLSEQVAYAVTKMINTEKIDMEIDLHESSPEYAVNNACVAHERAMAIAAEGVLNLEMEDISMRLEPSPVTLHGLTHRELGDATDTYALLLEVGNPSQGRFRGYTDEALVLTGADPCYVKAQELGLLYVDYSAGNFPLSLRVARHIAGCAAFIEAYNDSLDDDGRAIIIGNVPDYNEMVETDDLGLYLR